VSGQLGPTHRQVETQKLVQAQKSSEPQLFPLLELVVSQAGARAARRRRMERSAGRRGAVMVSSVRG
jgi:hypothetical protein